MDLNFPVEQNDLSRLLTSRMEVKELVTMTRKQPDFGIRPDDSDKKSQVHVKSNVNDRARRTREHNLGTESFLV
jgi:hypothetical protein